MSELVVSETGRTMAPRGPSGRDSAEDLYQEILARTVSGRKKRYLSNVRQALAHLRDLGSSDFSWANVGRAVEGLGLPGPKTQSIRNADGKDYRDLITAFAAEAGVRPEAKATPEDEIEAKLVGVDLRTAAQVRWILQENKSLKRRLDLLKRAFSELQPVTEQELVAGRMPALAPGAAAGQAFTDAEVAAVRKFLTDLPELDWEVDPSSGALVRRGGFDVAAPGFYQALQKITTDSKDETVQAGGRRALPGSDRG